MNSFEFVDNGIEKFFLNELKTQMNRILENKEYENDTKNKEALLIIREINDSFKKS